MLTPQGERALIVCRVLFNAACDFHPGQPIVERAVDRHLRIGPMDNLVSLPGNLLSLAIKGFQRRSQDVQLQCRIGSPAEIAQDLLN